MSYITSVYICDQCCHLQPHQALILKQVDDKPAELQETDLRFNFTLVLLKFLLRSRLLSKRLFVGPATFVRSQQFETDNKLVLKCVQRWCSHVSLFRSCQVPKRCPIINQFHSSPTSRSDQHRNRNRGGQKRTRDFSHNSSLKNIFHWLDHIHVADVINIRQFLLPLDVFLKYTEHTQPRPEA